MKVTTTENLVLDFLNIMPEIIYSKEFLLFDNKRLVPEMLEYSEDSFRLLMKFFYVSQGNFGRDFESREVVKTVFQKYGWEHQYCDVINSFYCLFVRSLVRFSDLNKQRTESIFRELGKKWNCNLYGLGNKTELQIAMCGQLGDCGKRKFAEKYLEENNLQRNIIDKYYFKHDAHNNVKEFSARCHCIANFMPCPPHDNKERSFNQVKGVLPDVKDFLNLMIDKIQICIDNNEKLIYKYRDSDEEITLVTLKVWKKWFIENRGKYCLEDYYEITEEGKIKGIPLFEGQSLGDKALPENDQMDMCINSIIEKINNRAKKIATLNEESEFED